MEKERFTGRSYDDFKTYLRDKSERTRTIYTRGLEKFLEHYDMDTEELYNQYIQDLASDDRRDRGRVGKMVTNLMLDLQDRGYSGNYALEIKKGVNAFFRANLEEVVYTSTGIIDKSTNGKDRMTKEHLRAIQDVTGSMRNKSIITMGKDTGLRVSDLVNIRVKHVIDAIRDDRDFHTFEIEVEKTTGETGVKANPVFGPDAMKYLRLWWKEREKYGCGEDPDDYLYCTVEDKPEYVRGGKVMSGWKKGGSLSSNAISVMIHRLVKKAGLEDENISAHSIRKYHETELGRAVKDTWIDKMTGRAEGYKGVYIKPDADELIAEYRKGYDEISLTPKREIDELELRKKLALDAIDRLPLDENVKGAFRRMIQDCATSEQLISINKKVGEASRNKEIKDVMIISEGELENHLNHGWEYVGSTPSGKCIIKNLKRLS